MASLIAIALAVGGALWLLKLRGPVLTFSLAAVAFGCAGYMALGTPGLSGVAREGQARPAPLSLAGARKAMLGQFDNADVWLTMSENFAARGKTDEAVGILLSATREHPRDYKLWVGLGNALSDRDRTLSPSARFAFERAEQLAPNYPGPLFFYGLAEARSGNPEAAAEKWRRVLASAPANASWRSMVEDGLRTIDAGSETAAPTGKPTP